MLDCSRATADSALRAVVGPFAQAGAFRVVTDQPGAVYEIAWQGPLTSARYRFQLVEQADGTEIRARMSLGGVLGPLHTGLRRRGNRDHLDVLLARIRAAAAGPDAASEAAERKEGTR